MYKRDRTESPRVQHEREKFHYTFQARRREHELVVKELTYFDDSHWEEFIERASHAELQKQWSRKTVLPAACSIGARFPNLDRVTPPSVTAVYVPCCDAKNNDGNNACLSCFQGDLDHVGVKVEYAPWTQVRSVVVCTSRVDWWNDTERFREERTWCTAFMMLILRFPMLGPMRNHFRNMAKKMIWPPYKRINPGP